MSLDRLIEEFPDKFNHDGVLDWFDNEFKPVLGVDIYEHKFPHDIGHLASERRPL